MLQRYHNLLTFLDRVGTIEGKDKIQKTVYLLQEAGCNFNEKFDYHLNGAYSESLLIKLDEMKFFGLIEVNVIETDTGNKQYQYSLSQIGRQYLQSLYDRDKSNNLKNFDSLLDNLLNYDAHTLKLLTIVKFLQNIGYDDSQIMRTVKELGQNYSDSEIQKSIEFLYIN